MANNWYTRFTSFVAGTSADAEDVEGESASILAAFDKMPKVVENLTNDAISFVTESGTANAYAVTFDPVRTAYRNGDKVCFIATNNNTGASTIKFDSLATKPLVTSYGVVLAANAVVSGNIIEARYDSANNRFLIVSPTDTATAASFAAAAAASAAAAVGSAASFGLDNALSNDNASQGTDLVMTAGDKITTDIIAETTVGSGVTIDGTLVKDGVVTANLTGNASGTAATVTGAAQTAITTLSNLVTVGALDAGSITSGFGAIDIGTSTLAAGATDITGTLGVSGVLTVGNTGGLSAPSAGTGAIGSATTLGVIIAGSGTTYDATIYNKNIALVLAVPTGTQNVLLSGTLDVSGLLTVTGSSSGAQVSKFVAYDTASTILSEWERVDGAVSSDLSFDGATGKMTIGTTTAHDFAIKSGGTEAVVFDDATQGATFSSTLDASGVITASAGLKVSDGIVTNTGDVGIGASHTTSALRFGSNGSYIGRNASDGSQTYNTGQGSHKFTGGAGVDITGTLDVSGALASTGQVTSTGVIWPGGPAASEGRLIGIAADGAVIAGNGTTNDVTLVNKNGFVALRVPTGTVNLVANGTLTVSDNIVIGTSGKGIDFDAAAGGTSQLLDWYEEGTFTPTLSFGGGSTGITYNAGSTLGRYTRTGNSVEMDALLTLTNKGSSTGQARVGGQPFTALAGMESTGVVYSVGLTISNAVVMQMNGSNSDVGFVYGTGVALLDSHFTNTSAPRFSISYKA